MDTLFLIGNGFDLNCGMKTRYFDVYEGYVREKSASDVIKKFKESISADIENWGDFEMAMAQYAEEIESEKEFLECVRDFAVYMKMHLKKESVAFKKKLVDNQRIRSAVLKEADKSFSAFYLGISHNVDRIMSSRDAGNPYTINAVSFNYTDVFDIIFSQYIQLYRMKERKVIHVHGVLQEDPVFGIDNEAQMKLKFTLTRKGKRGFIKPVFNEEFDRYRVEQARNRINEASTICAYGMSLGESDLSWRNAIMEWLRRNSNHHFFVYQYELSDATYRTIDEKMDLEEDTKESLLSKWGIDSDDAIFERIHIPCGKNIFNIREVIEKEGQRIEKGKEFVEQHLQEDAV